jgi:hypothetical protein
LTHLILPRLAAVVGGSSPPLFLVVFFFFFFSGGWLGGKPTSYYSSSLTSTHHRSGEKCYARQPRRTHDVTCGGASDWFIQIGVAMTTPATPEPMASVAFHHFSAVLCFLALSLFYIFSKFFSIEFNQKML